MIHLSQTNTKGFDELVFDHRNQAYGAYVLRREYPRHVLKSLLIGVALLASILAIPYLGEFFKKEKPNKPPVSGEFNFLPIVQPDKEKQPEVKQKVKELQPVGKTKTWTNITITVDDIIDSPPTTEDFKDFDPGKYNNNGDPNTWGIPCDDCIEDEGETVDIKKKTYNWVELEQKPEFPGGDPAMLEFLGNNLVYPEHAKQIGLEGKVYVTFVIDEFGNVVNVKVPREIGGGLDEEAKRVIEMMPRWEPGKQAGHPVRVSYQLPIIFALH
jgi:periplasmic protein TonB